MINMGHFDKIKEMLLEKGFTENDYNNIKNILITYYKFYVENIRDKIDLFICNKQDFYAMLKIALANQDSNQTASDIMYNIYNRYIKQNEINDNEFENFDLFDHWITLYEKPESPDEELFNKLLNLL